MIVRNFLSSFSENFRYVVVGDIYKIFKEEDNCRSGASEGTTLNTETVKRFSDFAHRYILMEFSVAQIFWKTV